MTNKKLKQTGLDFFKAKDFVRIAIVDIEDKIWTKEKILYLIEYKQEIGDKDDREI